MSTLARFHLLATTRDLSDMPDVLFVTLVSLLALTAVATLFWARDPLRETTLLGAWCWTVAAVVCVALVEVLAALEMLHPDRIAAWRIVSVSSTFCPMMAVLGAKRPQHRGWALVVISLWVILALPAGEAILLNRSMELAGLRWWFFLCLIAGGWLNAAATRFLWPATLLAVAQILLLADQMPFPSHRAIITSGLLTGWLATVWTCLILRRRSHAAFGWSRAWVDFRDLFGLLWSLRVQERMNAVARQHDWPVQLLWRGFAPEQQAETLDAETRTAVDQSMRNLLRRFVSSQWIEERIRG